MKKRAEIGWSFIVKLLIGLLLLGVLLYIAVKTKGSFSNMFRSIGELFG